MTAPAAINAGWVIRSDTQARLTLAEMRKSVISALGNQDWLLFARGVIIRSGAPSRDAQAMAYAIRDYVARHLKFVRDPVGIENLTRPVDHMRQLEQAGPSGYILGDCDDAATLSAALAGAVGIPSTFTVLAFDWGRGASPYQHVFTTLYPPKGRPVVCDTTRDAQKLPPKVARRFTIKV